VPPTALHSNTSQAESEKVASYDIMNTNRKTTINYNFQAKQHSQLHSEPTEMRGFIQTD